MTSNIVGWFALASPNYMSDALCCKVGATTASLGDRNCSAPL